MCLRERERDRRAKGCDHFKEEIEPFSLYMKTFSTSFIVLFIGFSKVDTNDLFTFFRWNEFLSERILIVFCQGPAAAAAAVASPGGGGGGFTNGREEEKESCELSTLSPSVILQLRQESVPIEILKKSSRAKMEKEKDDRRHIERSKTKRSRQTSDVTGKKNLFIFN